MKDGSQAAVRACKCPPSDPARDMERDNIGGHTGHQGTTTSGGPQHPHLVLTLPCAHFFLQFLPSFQPCVLCKCMVVCPVWAAPLGPNMTHLSQLPRPRVEPKPGHERGRGVGGDRPNYGGLASLFLARVKSSRNWLCSWSLVDNCNVITW